MTMARLKMTNIDIYVNAQKLKNTVPFAYLSTFIDMSLRRSEMQSLLNMFTQKIIDFQCSLFSVHLNMSQLQLWKYQRRLYRTTNILTSISLFNKILYNNELFFFYINAIINDKIVQISQYINLDKVIAELKTYCDHRSKPMILTFPILTNQLTR